uniref:uncharacterized protein LOC108950928 n=1 Tax=Ciona intestinalis TaxID=7719 RepID=UPI00089DC30A|nr:uncharacterized protein LOC108950928 [Ciona intestinalis]|eukprot:XP_018672733.1 uncharacterized protein LOC108950928 [Ciona intestinalis]
MNAEYRYKQDDGLNSETKVVGDFRLWHIIAICVGGISILVVACACACKCRIPRTRAQIEENRKKRNLRKRYRFGGSILSNGSTSRSSIIETRRLSVRRLSSKTPERHRTNRNLSDDEIIEDMESIV